MHLAKHRDNPGARILIEYELESESRRRIEATVQGKHHVHIPHTAIIATSFALRLRQEALQGSSNAGLQRLGEIFGLRTGRNLMVDY